MSKGFRDINELLNMLDGEVDDRAKELGQEELVKRTESALRVWDALAPLVRKAIGATQYAALLEQELMKLDNQTLSQMAAFNSMYTTTIKLLAVAAQATVLGRVADPEGFEKQLKEYVNEAENGNKTS